MAARRASVRGRQDPEGFTDDQIAALKRIVRYLGLAIKSVSLARTIELGTARPTQSQTTNLQDPLEMGKQRLNALGRD